MKTSSRARTKKELLDEIRDLKRRLEEAEETLRAIQSGEVDAVVVSGPQGEQIFTLEGAERPYRVLLETMNEGALTLSSDGTILYSNRSFAEILKTSLDKVIGSSIHNFIPSEEEQRIEALLQEGQKRSSRSEISLNAMDGTRVFAHLSILPLPGGELPTTCAVVTDLTQQREHEEIVASERLSRIILEQATDAIIVCDGTGTIIRASLMAHWIGGRNPLHQLFDTVFPVELSSGKTLSFFEMLEGKVTQGTEVRLTREDGRVFHLLLSAGPLRDELGGGLATVITMTDITERKQAEQELDRARVEAENERRRLEALMEALPVGVALTDVKGGPLRSNKAFEEIWGAPRPATHSVSDYALYKAWWSETGEPVVPEEWASAQAVKRGEAVVGQLMEIQRFNGSRTSVINSGAPVFDAEGKIAGCAVAIQDITDLRNAQQALRESEERYRHLTEVSPDAIVVHTDGRFAYVNPATLELYGARREEDLLGRPVLELICPDERGAIASRIDQIQRGTEATTPLRETCILRLDGGERNVEVAAVGILYNGRPAVQAVLHDITERKRAEAETRGLLTTIQQEKERLSALINSISDEVWFADTEKKFTLANPSALQEFGFSSIDGREVEKFADSLQVYRPDGTSRPVEEAPPLLALKGELVRNNVEIIRTPVRGELRYRQVSASPVRGPGGDIIGSVSVVRDITESKRAEEELRESEERLRRMIETSPIAIGFGDSTGKIFEANDSFYRLTGYTREEIQTSQLGWDQLTAPEYAILDGQIMATLAATGSAGPYEKEYIRKDGSRVPLLLSVSKLPGRDEHIAFIVDITERKQREEELVRLASFPRLNPNPVVEVDLAGHVLYSNPSAERLFPDLKEAGPNHAWLADLAKLGETLETEGRTTQVRELKIGDHWYQETVHSVMGGTRFRIYGFDITERKPAEEALRKSQEDLDRAQQVGQIGSWRLDVRKNVLTWSEENHRIFGIPKGTPMTYETFLSTVHPDDREYVDTRWKAGLRGEPYDIEHRIVVDGQIKWVREKAYLEFGNTGELLGGFGITQDINERKQAEKSLRKSKERFELLSKTASRLLATDQPQKMVNELCQKVIEHLDCHTCFNYLVDEETQRLHLNAYVGIPEETSKEIEWLDYGVAVCGCAARDACRIVAEDIPNTPDPRTDLVKSFGIKAYACHPIMSGAQVIGTLSFGTRSRTTFSEDELALMKTVTDQVATAIERMRLYESRQRLLEKIEKSRDELEVRIQERTRELASAVDTLREEGRVRMKAEEALRTSSLYARSLIEASLDPLMTISADEKVTDVNRAAELTTGLSRQQLIGSDFSGYFSEPEKAREGYRMVLQQGLVRDYPLAIRHTSGVFTDVLYNATVYKNEAGEIQGVFAAARDITEQKKAEKALREVEKRLLQAQKMEAIGTLAGGIAHDFNNILMPIVMNTELALLDIDKEGPAANSLRLVLNAATRGKEMVKQIISFSRMKERERSPVRLSSVVKEGLKLLTSSLPKQIEIRHQIGAESAMVSSDPTQIHQILMNISNNASQAMGERGGVLLVSLNEVEVDENMASLNPDLKPGPYVVLRVDDTGHGMIPEVMEKVFDPFFTTRDPSEGTGMGMAVVHGIVRSHGGAITVASEVDKGSSFGVYFPRIQEEEEEGKNVDRLEYQGGSENILIVDDEKPQVVSLQNMLERLGYRVTGKTSGPEALEIFRAQPENFDLVITDEMMPGMRGSRLAEEMLKVRPGLPIILCTGYSETIDQDKVTEIGIRELMMKPFGIREISQTIRKILLSFA